ncbi:hypothetical protein QEZ48_19275 [Aquamicrobium lusatiense]|uniref:hypothetical protein n=1 Tax=Aquamicrobium lusatiense TaxID=89772 RepID=UPI0024549777|nr:hypothetical protein [Aquamicrobium lusatiense]MDH4992960.1 hypothetical protein [Aquamicrobium lusatiense]
MTETHEALTGGIGRAGFIFHNPMFENAAAAVRALPAWPERFQETWKRFSGSETRQTKDLKPFK